MRIPSIDAPFGVKQNKAVAISYSGLDIYGFHLLESLQCLTERRRGGETGVKAVQCFEGDECWRYMSQNPWVERLFNEALKRSNTRKPGDPKALVKNPSVFVIDYADGLQAAAFLMTGMVEDFTIAIDLEGKSDPFSVLMNLQNGRPHHHFGCLTKKIEEMFETGKAPYPVERSLLTSGMLDFALESRFQGHKRLETPELAKVRYQTTAASHFCKDGWS
jgi:hypothetical protein